MKKENVDRKAVIAKQIDNVKKRTPMVVYLTVFIFAVCSVTSLLLLAVYYILISLNVLTEMNIYFAGLILLVLSVVISTSLVRGFGNKILFGSLRQIKDASKAVAAGDFSQRLATPREKETAEICESFNEMVDRLGRNEMLASDFISNVSHQFRNPLASISGYAQLLENGDLSEEEKKEYLGIIREKASSLSELVNDILDLSKIEHTSERFEMSEFRADEQLSRCLLAADSKLKQKEIETEIDIRPTKCYGNSDLVYEAYSNLIENALKFSNHGGVIRITLCETDGNAVFTVFDNGVGMSDETREHIFERFYRGKEVIGTEGSGLGMAIVNNIVKLHKGKITVESRIGIGSRFTLKLPSAKNSDE